MADEPLQPQTPGSASRAAPSPPSISEQYDLGDRAVTPEAPPSAPAASDVQPGPLPPRGADGRFLPRPPHSPVLVRMARDLGFSAEEVEATPAEDLRIAVQAAQLERQSQTRAQTMEQALTRPLEQPTAVAPADTYDTGLDEANYDPGLLGLIKKQGQIISKLEAQVREISLAGARQSVAARVDKIFEKHEAFVGKGRGNELAPESADLAKRRAVLGLVDSWAKAPGTLEQKIDRAVEVLFGKAASKPAKAEPPAQDTDWATALARPTHRTGGAEPAGLARAEAGVAAYLKENGMDRAPSIADEFPG